jgi:hypothetical protein
MRKKSSRTRLGLAVLEPEVLRLIGEESRRNGTTTLSSRRIDQLIKATRRAKKEALMTLPGLVRLELADGVQHN